MRSNIYLGEEVSHPPDRELVRCNIYLGEEVSHPPEGELVRSNIYLGEEVSHPPEGVPAVVRRKVEKSVVLCEEV